MAVINVALQIRPEIIVLPEHEEDDEGDEHECDDDPDQNAEDRRELKRYRTL